MKTRSPVVRQPERRIAPTHDAELARRLNLCVRSGTDRRQPAEGDEALRLAQTPRTNSMSLKHMSLEPTAMDMEQVLDFARTLERELNALSTRSCSECAKFKRLQAELDEAVDCLRELFNTRRTYARLQGTSVGEKVEAARDDFIDAEYLAEHFLKQRAEAAERKLGEKG